jgi:hypothetical protein
MGSGFVLGVGEGVVGRGVGDAEGVDVGAVAGEGGAELLAGAVGEVAAVGVRSSLQPATSASSPVVTTRAIDRLMDRVFPLAPVAGPRTR